MATITRHSTSICGGFRRIAIGKRTAISILLALGLSGCAAPGEASVSDAPIVVIDPGSLSVSSDLVLANAQTEVTKILPKATLAYFSFIGDCSELAELKGRFELSFVEERPALFGKRVFIARVVVDTSNQLLDMETKDETEHYPTTTPLILTGKSVKQIAEDLQAYLEAADRCNSQVVLARTETLGPWRVRCGPPQTEYLECIKIDPHTGEFTEGK
jgi:hypothetical protein